MAKVAAIAESDARRGVAADATMAASGLSDAAARTSAGATAAAADIDTKGALSLGANAETRERGEMADAATRGEIAATSGELQAAGLEGQNNLRAVGTGIQTAGEGIDRAISASAPEPPASSQPGYLDDPDVIQSDPRAKESVHPLEKVNAYSFEYKPGMGHKRGPQIGVMADELERDPVANSLVSRGPNGLRQVDTGGAAMLSLATSAAQEKRISRLEKLLNGRP
jgi:hypothetical protein